MIKTFFLFPKNIQCFYVFVFFSACLFFLPVEALILQKHGLSLTQITWIYAWYALATFLLEIPTGMISDSMGRKKTFLWYMVFMIGAVFCLGFGSSVGAFFVYASLLAIARALFSGTDEAFIMESLKESGQEDKIDSCMNLYFILWTSVASVASLGGVFIAKFNLNWTAILSLIPLLFALMMVLCIHEPRVAHEKFITSIGYKKFFKNALRYLKEHSFLRKLTIFFISITSVDLAWHYYAPVLHEFKHLSLEMIGVLGAFYFGFTALGSFLLVFLEKYFLPKHIIITSTVLIPVFLIAALFVEDPMIYALCFCLASMPWGVRAPLLRRQFQENSAPEMRATVSSIASLGMEFSGFLFLVILLPWSKILSIQGVYVLVCVVLALTCLFPTRFYWKDRE